MAIRFIDNYGGDSVVLTTGSFPSDSLTLVNLQNVQFVDCYFQRTTLAGAKLKNCKFTNCEFECIELSDAAKLTNVELHDCTCRSVQPIAGTASLVFAPSQIPRLLADFGFRIESETRVDTEPSTDPDIEMVHLEKMCRIFLRSTGLNEFVIRQRFGQHARDFLDSTIPQLVDAGVLREVEFRGGGKQKRFHLATTLRTVQDAVAHATGNFTAFLEYFDSES